MVLIHIISKNEQQTVEIADQLLKQKLILNAVITKNIMVRTRLTSGQISNDQQFLLLGETKALLFNKIDSILRDKYMKSMPLLYSIPIVNMDWEQADRLISNTLQV
ncbi:MAG: hypothetical protein ACJA08_003152 [Cyclobacteriaceae bacterium]|jgi:uncharacterized protein involved in tolerance to divalent cations